jgi:hypothetical protein
MLLSVPIGCSLREVQEHREFSLGTNGTIVVVLDAQRRVRELRHYKPDQSPNGLPIAADGCGNFWVLDLTPQTTQVAPVFYACHDAPVILYQGVDVASFLSELFRMYTPPHKSLVQDVLRDTLFNVWRKNPGVIDQPAAAASPDAALRAFASGLPAQFQIIDLRGVDAGMGF